MAEESVDKGPPKAARRAGRALAVDQDSFYILATAPQADDRSRVLKHGDTFAVFDHYGDFKPLGLGEEGLYHEGTRYLSGLVLRLGTDHPLFLSSTVRQDNDLLTVDLTNPDLFEGSRIAVPRGSLHVSRYKFLWQGACYERISVKNYGSGPASVSLFLFFEADFRDIFEVRGTRRKHRGEYLDTAAEPAQVTLAYRGRDGVVRRTRLTWSPAPSAVSDSEVRFDLVLAPQEDATIDGTVFCERGKAAPTPLPYSEALESAAARLESIRNRSCTIWTVNDQFNHWLNRSVADLAMMITETPVGLYPYAGVPWFSTAFGRDGILTAMEYLWIDPSLAAGVLAYLAHTQATSVVAEQDAEPGKILHETRDGEMAALGEIPFGRYFGSVDATPLFVWLAGAYYERTGDRHFIQSIWPNIEAALHWLDTYGDADHDGFVEYHRHSSSGLVHQGWKDSHDAVFHADGTAATGPIALCEVQGYVYAAKRAAAALARVFGDTTRAEELSRESEDLRERFEQAFWCEDLSTYALALDGNKQPCRVRSSNAGQCLLTGIVGLERARRVARTLLAPDSYSGWGVRTVAASEARYNPMSYHNGSVWPHDNALIAAGLARHGLKTEASRILVGLYEASISLDLHRMPELFCGFGRRAGEGPTLYPVACAPQAWSAAAAFLLVQACLGLSIKAEEQRVEFRHPVLPECVPELLVRNLHVGTAAADLRLVRHGNDVGLHVLRREGDIEIVMVK
jgi:glycogen debranching enzyme